MSSSRALLAAMLLAASTTIAEAQAFVGKWRVETDGSLIEFRANGTLVQAEPALGFNTEGTWRMVGTDELRIEAQKQVWTCKVAVEGRTMRLSNCPIVGSHRRID